MSVYPAHLSHSATLSGTQDHTHVWLHGASSADLRPPPPLLILLILSHSDSHGALSTEGLRTARHALNRPTLQTDTHLLDGPRKKMAVKKAGDLVMEQQFSYKALVGELQ